MRQLQSEVISRARTSVDTRQHTPDQTGLRTAGRARRRCARLLHRARLHTRVTCSRIYKYYIPRRRLSVLVRAMHQLKNQLFPMRLTTYADAHTHAATQTHTHTLSQSHAICSYMLVCVCKCAHYRLENARTHTSDAHSHTHDAAATCCWWWWRARRCPA